MPHITSSSISNADAALESTALAKQGLPIYFPPVVQPANDNSGKKREGVTEHGENEDPGLAALRESPYDYVGLVKENTPEPPPAKALKADWVDHVVATTDIDQETAESMTKADLMNIANGGDQSSAGTNSSPSDSRQDKSGSSALETESPLQSPAPTTENPSSPDQAPEQVPSSTAPLTSGSTPETGPSQPDPSNSSEEPQTPQPSETEATQHPSGLSARELVHAARAEYEAKNFDAARQLLLDAKALDASMEEELNLALQAVQTASNAQAPQQTSEEDPSQGGFLVQ